MVSEYEQYSEIDELHATKWKKLDLMVPANFRLLCAILDVKVEDVLHDFMWMLSYSSLKEATPRQRTAARKFFLLCGYGKANYSEKQVSKMFKELESIRRLCDTIDGMEAKDMELFWKNQHMYLQYWFKRWFKKNSRPDELTVLQKY